MKLLTIEMLDDFNEVVELLVWLNAYGLYETLVIIFLPDVLADYIDGDLAQLYGIDKQRQ